jgi:hypothetical protein
LFYLGLGLADRCLRLLFLRRSLFKSDARVAVIKPNQNISLLDEAADVKIDLRDLSRNGRGNIRLFITGKVTRGLEIRRYRLHNRRCRRYIHDRWLFVGVAFRTVAFSASLSENRCQR